MKWLLASILALSVFITQAATAPTPRTDPYNTLATGTAWIFTTHDNGAILRTSLLIEFDNVTSIPTVSWHRDRTEGMRAIGLFELDNQFKVYWVPEALIDPAFDPVWMIARIKEEPVMLDFYNLKTQRLGGEECYTEFLGMEFLHTPMEVEAEHHYCPRPKTAETCVSTPEFIKSNMNVRGGVYQDWVNRVSTGRYIPDATLVVSTENTVRSDKIGWTVLGAALFSFTVFTD